MKLIECTLSTITFTFWGMVLQRLRITAPKDYSELLQTEEVQINSDPLNSNSSFANIIYLLAVSNFKKVYLFFPFT